MKLMNLEQDAFDLMSSDVFLAPVVNRWKRKKRERKFARRLNEFLANERVPWRTRYKAHLRSDRWKLFRLSIIAKRGMMCERCGKFKDGVDVHHLSYVRLGHELPEDVKLLCRDCHNLMHPRNLRIA